MPDLQKPDPISKEIIAQFSRSTGMDAKYCKKILNEASPLLYHRMLEAAATQGKQLLHDPIEDNPEYAEAMQMCDELAEIELKPQFPSGPIMGYCHWFWEVKQRILREEFGIEWFSLAEMNPSVMFD